MRWYNVDHRHSGIRYVSHQQRHAGEDQAILAARHDLHAKAKLRNPARWSGNTRDWSQVGAQSAIRSSIWLPPLKLPSRKLRDSGGNYLDARRVERADLAPEMLQKIADEPNIRVTEVVEGMLLSGIPAHSVIRNQG